MPSSLLPSTIDVYVSDPPFNMDSSQIGVMLGSLSCVDAVDEKVKPMFDGTRNSFMAFFMAFWAMWLGSLIALPACSTAVRLILGLLPRRQRGMTVS